MQDNGLKIDIELLFLLTHLMSKQQIKSYQDESISENGNIYFWLAPKKTILDLPILVQNCKNDRAKLDKIRGLYKALIDFGFMEAYHKNQEIAKAYYTFTEKASLTLTEKTVTPYEENCNNLTGNNVSPYGNFRNPLTENDVSSSILDSSIIKSNILLSNEGEETPTPRIENVDFDDVPFGVKGDLLNYEKEKSELESRLNNLPLEEKKEIRKKVAPKKEKETKPVLKTMAEAYPNEADFVTAWGLRFGAKYPNVDASKGYNRILLYCESSGKKYADYVRVLLVWYTGEAEAKKQQYHYDKATKQSENYLDKLFYDIQNADPNIV